MSAISPSIDVSVTVILKKNLPPLSLSFSLSFSLDNTREKNLIRKYRTVGLQNITAYTWNVWLSNASYVAHNILSDTIIHINGKKEEKKKKKT